MQSDCAVLLVCLCAACGGSSTSPGGSPGSSSQVLTLSVDGAAVDLSARSGATKANAPYSSEIQGQDAAGSTFLTIELGVYPPVAGTYSCPTNGVGILYSSGGAYYAGVNSAALTDPTPTSCTITITSYSGAGQPFEGTFSGTLAEAHVANATHTITNGHFRMLAP